MRVDAVVAGLGASLDLRVLFEARDLDAKVSLEFQPSAPFVSRSRVSLMEPPRTSLRIAPEGLGGLSLTDLPGVDGWLKSGAFVLFALHAVAVSFAERLRFSPTHPQPSVSTNISSLSLSTDDRYFVSHRGRAREAPGGTERARLGRRGVVAGEVRGGGGGGGRAGGARGA
jgi:hypothetical protein